VTRNCHRVFGANSIPFFDVLLAKKSAFFEGKQAGSNEPRNNGV